MELRQLRYFVAAAEEQHFARAAHRLHIAAPSLSQQIHALERDLRVTLFDRSPRGVALTPAGTSLLEHARILLARAERAVEEVRCAEGRHRPLKLHVVAGTEHVLRDGLHRLCNSEPRLEVAASTSTEQEAIRAVREERADAAVLWGHAAESKNLARITLREVSVHLALPASHRLASHRTVPVVELASEAIIVFPRELSMGAWDRVVDHLLPNGSKDYGRLRTQLDMINPPEGTLRSVAAGHGVAPVTEAAAEHARMTGIVVRPIVPPLLLPLDLVWREPAHPVLPHLIGRLTPGDA